jgi:acyl carrier protein
MADPLISQVERTIRLVLQLGDDIQLAPDSDLVHEIGLDSLEAFETIATLHELLGVRIPDDMNPQSFATIGRIAENLTARYEPDRIQAFLRLDVAARLLEMSSASDLD